MSQISQFKVIRQKFEVSESPIKSNNNSKITSKLREAIKAGGDNTPQTVLIGNRIPKEYFVTKGSGESDIQIHAGSYHLALKDAGIECYNIMTYSSILPNIAVEIERPQTYTHGAVAETITASASTTKGKRATAAIIYGWLFNKKTGERYGGLVCEYNGNLSEKDAAASLRESIDELYQNGFSDQYDLRDTRLTTNSIIPKKKFGTALVAIVFTSYVVPIIG